MKNGNAQAQNPQAANLMARNYLVANAQKRHQLIFAETVDPASQVEVRVPPAFAGLGLGFIVNVTTEITTGAGATPLTKTSFGPANLLKEIRFDDLNQNTRIQTSGWHMHSLNSARASTPYMSVDMKDAYPIDYGNFYSRLMQGPDAIGVSTNFNVSATYYVPLAYSDLDLRGAIYLNVVNATASLNLTLNNALVQARTLQASTEAAYVTVDAGTPPADVTVGPFEIQVYQVYYDMLPKDKNTGQPILPAIDLSVVYDIKNTNFSGLTPGQDFNLAYSNYRDYLSTFALYRNRIPPDDAGFALEADINSWALQAANYTNIWKVDPYIAGGWGRQVLETDFPLGLYYFPTRTKPISTNQYGNMGLIINPAVVQPGASVIVGYEAFAWTNRIGGAATLNPA